MGSRRSVWGGLLVALAATGAQGQEARRVRLALKDGAVVEGRLEAYGDRTYRVTLADGRTRQVHEREVTRVDFDPAAALVPAGPTATLAEVVRRAVASGALAQRLGVPVHLSCVDRDHERPGGPHVEGEYLVRLVTTVDAAAGTLTLEAETRLRKPKALDPRLLPDLNQHGPTRYRWTVGLADGRLRRYDAFSGRVDIQARVDGGRARIAQRKDERSDERELDFSAEWVPFELLAFVLAPLHDQGLPASLAVPYRQGEETVRVRALPTIGPDRTVELASERSGEPTGDVTRVVVNPARGVVRLEAVRVGAPSEVRVTKETTTAERITPEAYEARVAEWSAAQAPTGPRAAPTNDAPDPVAALLVAARADGSLARLEGERWFAARGDGGVVTLTRVVGRRDGDALTLEVHRERVGDPTSSRLERCTWDPAGRLREVWLRDSLDGVPGEGVGRVESGRLVVAVTTTAPGAPPVSREQGVVLPPGAIPVAAARFGLSALGASLPASLRVVGVSVELDRLRLFPLVLERTPAGVRLADGPGKTVDPLYLATTGPDGELLTVGFDPAGLHGVDGAPVAVDEHAARAVTAAEARALRDDPQAVAAGRTLAAREAERAVEVVLGRVHRAQATFRANDADRDGEPDFAADLDELRRADLLDPTLHGGQAHGYRVVVGRASGAPEERWLAVADPVDPTSGARSLAVTQTGVVLAGPGPFGPVGADALPPAGAKEVR